MNCKENVIASIVTITFVLSGIIYAFMTIAESRSNFNIVSSDESVDYVCEHDSQTYYVMPLELSIEEECYDDSKEEYTDDEKKMLARVIMSEGSNLPYHGKIAIMATIMNRVNSDKYPNTIREVLYNTGFSFGNNGEPTEECYLAINDYVSSGWPEDMYWFRDTYPHSYGYEYLHIGNMYFNTERNYYGNLY